MVTNLLSNAIKYGMGKPIRLGAEARRERVRIWVEDAGPGIARADQQRIFHAFERLASAHRVGGLGLGLYIGQQIAAAHGGALEVESEPGQGARFTLELPSEPRRGNSPMSRGRSRALEGAELGLGGGDPGVSAGRFSRDRYVS